MKKLFFVLMISCASIQLFAKKVKFRVDMRNETINTTGIHVTGDFQAAAGFPNGDWQPNTTTLTVEAGTNIYSVVVDIPAKRKYEYKYVNGDQSYEVEFIQDPSRVGYDFNDNRWVYIDSLADDTTVLDPIMFAGNAPYGKKLLRLIVDLRSEASVSSNGVHLIGNFNGWNATSGYIYSFVDKISEGIVFIDSGATAEYKFVNGNITSAAETVPAGCANTSGNRYITVNSDTVISVTCFAMCAPCLGTGIASPLNVAQVSLFPNPAADRTTLIAEGLDNYTVNLFDISGRLVQTVTNCNTMVTIETVAMQPGIYFVVVSDDHTQLTQKLVVE